MPRIYTRTAASERWFSHVQINHETGCWEIRNRGELTFGYPAISVREGNCSKNIGAHRVAYEHFIGPTNGLCVLHTCDNPKCSNPDHLFLGTRSENAADKVAKGRQCKGESANNKLMEFQVREIKELVAAGASQTAVAGKFNVHQSAISRIVNAKRWKHASV